MNLNTNITWNKGLSSGTTPNPYSLAGFNLILNSNKLSLSNTPEISLKDFNSGGGKSGGFDFKAGAMAAIPMVTDALGKLYDFTKRDMTDLQKTEFNAIYGRGEDPIFDLMHLKKDTKNAAQQIKNTAYSNTGVLGSNQDLLNTYNSFDFDSWKPNNDKINFWQANLKNLEASGKGASMGSSFGPWGALIGGIIGGVADLSSYIGSKKRRNLINDAKEMTKNLSLASWKEQQNNTNKQMNLSNYRNMKFYDMGGALDYSLLNLYALNSYVNALNKSKITSMPNSFYKPQFNSMNYFAMGGMPDFNEFNTGGTHEQNPNGGIPQGMDKLGVMNTVELGETKTTTPNGDYIFSDRLKLSKEECKQLGVPKDSTYAEASKLLRKEYDEMPNDDIAKRGWEQSRDMLIQSLEMLKQEIALKEARKQGLNSPKMLGVNPQVVQDMYYNENPQEEALLLQGINPDMVLNAFGGFVKLMRNGGDYNTPPNLSYFLTPIPSIVQNVEDMYNDTLQEFLDTLSKEDPNFNKNYYAEQSWNRMLDSLKDSTYNPFIYATYGDFVKDIGLNSNFTGNELEKSMYLYALDKAKLKNPIWFSGKRGIKPAITDLAGGRSAYDLNTGDILSTDGLGRIYNIKDQKYYPSNLNNTTNNTNTTSTNTNNITNNNDNKYFNLENLKYAPIVGNIAGLALNLFTPEDYSIPNRLLKEIDLLPRVSVLKNTNYMTFNPVDVNRYINQYNANAAAQRNAIMNTSNPNRNAALASAIYNANIGYGDLVQAIEAQNAKEKQAVQQFNAGIDQLNIANQLQADNINQNYEQMRINGIMQELAMRDAIQTARANAIQSNLKGLTDNMYNVYLDDQARRQAEIWHAGLAVPPNLKMLYLNKSINDLLLYTGLKNQGYDLTTANNIMKSMGIDISNLKWK